MLIDKIFVLIDLVNLSMMHLQLKLQVINTESCFGEGIRPASYVHTYLN